MSAYSVQHSSEQKVNRETGDGPVFISFPFQTLYHSVQPACQHHLLVSHQSMVTTSGQQQPLPCCLGFDPGVHCCTQEMALIWSIPYQPPPASANLCAHDNLIISSSGDPHIKPNLIRLYMVIFIDLERLRKVPDKNLFL
ncbi:hypothetical protein HJG60_008008 [Phyllostomus discolor]|uniref:Uncharacterized protein n=1 Tax=Phyllostomus discolor TaxID=89673 RepID=A0A834BLG0_9CHIR|nr:hypothetical protein HJG60_008008 [Phyllostomus discolor]